MNKHLDRLNSIFVLPFTLVLSLTFLTSCRSTSGLKSERNDAGSEITPAKPQDVLTGAIGFDPSSRGLANGWDSELHRKFAPCLDSSNFTYRGAQSSDLTFMRDFTYDQILKETGAGLYGKASLFGLASAKIQGDMAMSLASTDDSTSFIYNLSVLGKSAVLGERALNINGSSAYDSNNLARFRELCGDQFVEQVRVGGQLYIGVKYTFKSKETKDTISVKITLSLFWGLIKVSKTWSKEFRDMMKDVRISIEAFQIGGDPRQLAALKDSIYQKSCAGDEPEECAAAVDRLLEYGSKDFADQLGDLTLGNDPYKGPAIVDLALENYNALKIYDPKQKKAITINVTASTSPQSELALAIDKLAQSKTTLIMAQNRMKILREFKLDAADSQKVETASRKIDETLTAIDVASNTTCARAATDSSFIEGCLQKTADIVSQTKAAVVPVALKSTTIPQ
ncbi:MAG: hypothetical protein EOP07_03610 [Proteobacteria bacterium]|nr:MAG: hypothetical protein EOP07_03610 [Pseudomonadota bacterium]